MQSDLHTPLGREEVSDPEGGEGCSCARVHYGMVIMMVLIGFMVGVVIGIFLSVPLTAIACKNITGIQS